MNEYQMLLTVKTAKKEAEFSVRECAFSPFLCIRFDDSASEIALLQLLTEQTAALPGPKAYYGTRQLFDYMVRHCGGFGNQFSYIIEDDISGPAPETTEIPVMSPRHLPYNVQTVFIGHTSNVSIQRSISKISDSDASTISPLILPDINWRAIPDRAWIPRQRSIYPVTLPEIDIRKNLDILLIDCPSRDMALMPNGLAHVHNILKILDIQHQTVDLDIILYHRFHTTRLLDGLTDMKTPTNLPVPEDPWSGENQFIWENYDFVSFFDEYIEEAVRKIAESKPKVLALSVSGRNREFSKRVVRGVRQHHPEVKILVGGYSCINPEVGIFGFPDCDYMVVGEAEEVLPEVVNRILRGESPEGLPGVMMPGMDPGKAFITGPRPNDLDRIAFPRYEWATPEIYRNHNGYQLTPIISSRGCRWSRCHFCAERQPWRTRSAESVVEEIEWLADHGRDLFMFNESDLNGDPDVLAAICREILKRELVVSLTGQLRIHPKSDRDFFDLLHEAGFSVLRFGVDAWSKNTLKRQGKGYTTKLIGQNLEACHSAGIFTEVNAVLGVPGETDQDIRETIDLMIENKPFIGRVATLNPLMLFVGSAYWDDPERFNVVLHMSKQEIIEKYGYAAPAHTWHSENPHIDHEIRLERLYRIVKTLDQADINLSPMVKQRLIDMEKGLDRARGGAKPNNALSSELAEKKPDSILGKEKADIGETRRLQYHSTIYEILEQSIPKSSLWKKLARGLGFPIKHDFHEKTAALKNIDLENEIPEGSSNIQSRRLNMAVELIKEGFHGYNLVKADQCYYAVRQGYPVDWETVEFSASHGDNLIQGSSLRELQQKIPALSGKKSNDSTIGGPRQKPAPSRDEQRDLKPLVIGYPRTGFTLLISILGQLLPFTPRRSTRSDRMIKAFVNLAGSAISDAVVDTFSQHGIREDLVFNPAFRLLLGGPKWIHPENPDLACCRKYIGVRGLGDFTLITTHPHDFLAYDDIIHSHSYPPKWVRHPSFGDRLRFASLRNPAGTLSSACFSLNALTSEYIQHFVPPEQDNDELRQYLAMYKLTDMNFFIGLITPLKAYLEEFLTVRNEYTIMRWEDLIQKPAEAIGRIAKALGLDLNIEFTNQVWSSLNQTNLTTTHQHNYRKAGGIVGGWKSWLTNEHLVAMREQGLEELQLELGYGRIEHLRESQYTGFQKKIATHLQKGQVFRDYPDHDLFNFAFNKSNLDSSRFDFKRYEWKRNTQIERSSFANEEILMAVWEAAETATDRLNRTWLQVSGLVDGQSDRLEDGLKQIVADNDGIFHNHPRKDAAAQRLIRALDSPAPEPPKLIMSKGSTNIVFYNNIYYAIPQSLGPMDLTREHPEKKEGVRAADNLSALLESFQQEHNV